MSKGYPSRQERSGRVAGYRKGSNRRGVEVGHPRSRVRGLVISLNRDGYCVRHDSIGHDALGDLGNSQSPQYRSRPSFGFSLNTRTHVVVGAAILVSNALHDAIHGVASVGHWVRTHPLETALIVGALAAAALSIGLTGGIIYLTTLATEGTTGLETLEVVVHASPLLLGLGGPMYFFTSLLAHKAWQKR